jgi:hypothetical protein
VRAIHVGPGFLDYCPGHNGVGIARYELDLPGGPVVPGYCETVARRGHHIDVVIFHAYWDARKVNKKVGVASFMYTVDRKVSAIVTPLPHLTAQAGTLPP